MVQFVRIGFQVSERHACHVIPVHRSSDRYRSGERDQTALRRRIWDLAAGRVRYGSRRLQVLLQREGWRVHHKRVSRLYRLEGLSLRFQSRRKRPSHLRVVMPGGHAPDEHWSVDFIADSPADGRRFRAFT
jgi:putative transposase